MDKYQEMYIERKKQFEQSDTSPESVINLYNLKEKLEQIEDRKAKEALVNVYDLLNYKKSAYELLSEIGNSSDIKIQKRLLKMKFYAENWKDYFAIPKPKQKKI